MADLRDAIAERERAYNSAIDRLREKLDGDDEDWAAVQDLREAVELVRCLRRLVPACGLADIHKAFGAPGDFGYETPIGEALSRLYRGESRG